jgi:CubicO group peptidase (beta-lactamase class C family)
MQHNKQLFLNFIVLLLLINNAFAQTKKINQIDSLMNHYYKIGAFNGNVLVSKNNKIIYNASFGFTDATKTKKLTTDYRFNIGSITKEFSAVALMQLKEQGKLKVNDKISQFIPELPKWANEVAIEDLLQYKSGIPNVNWKSIQNDKDLFNGLMLIDTLDFKPGTNYDYNNNNIFLRQYTVERLTKMPFKTYVEKFIFKRCKMDFAELTPLASEENIAKGFNNNLIPDKTDLPITGGTYLTTIDLLKWVNCLHSEKIVNKKSLFEIGQQFNLEETQSALGLAKYKNGNLIEHLHDGRVGNYEAILVSNITKKFTIILLDNNYNGKVFEISDAIIEKLKN